MIKIDPSIAITLVFASLFCPSAGLCFGDTAEGRRGVVASVNPIATEAGRKAFERGGNAIDAAVAAAVTLGVVDSHNSGLGGGCFVLIHRADGTLLAIDGREMAPATATRDMFIRDGVAVPALSQHGALAIGVPGALAAYQQSIKQCGKLTLETSLRSAADVAEAGFKIDSNFARNISENQPLIARFPEASRILLKPDKSPYSEGETIRFPDLASSYRKIADDESWFYHGGYAEQVAHWMKRNGGLVTTEDFHYYKAIARTPIVSTYRGHQIVGFPPPTSGGVQVAQILNILENFDLADRFRQRPVEAYHIIAEAMKLSFADRTRWLGDADFAPVPHGLVDKEYAATLANRINPLAVSTVETNGFPLNWKTDVFQTQKHTTHVTAADAEGNWVAITATINTSFGSKVIVPGTGIVLNNTLDDFSAQPGVPNAFGLIGGDANAVAAMKRPLSAMSPTIVMKDGKPVFTVGGAGGPKIITQVAMAIIHRIDAKLSISDSVGRPRMHHQWLPNRLILEKSFEPELRAGLAKLGHEIEEIDRAAIVQAIELVDNERFIGVSDPRVPSKAMGFDELPLSR